MTSSPLALLWFLVSVVFWIAIGASWGFGFGVVAAVLMLGTKTEEARNGFVLISGRTRFLIEALVTVAGFVAAFLVFERTWLIVVFVIAALTLVLDRPRWGRLLLRPLRSSGS